MRLTLMLVLALNSALRPPHVSAQVQVIGPAPLSCQGCRLTAHPVASVGVDAASPALSAALVDADISPARRIALATEGSNAILVVDSAGRLLRTVDLFTATGGIGARPRAVRYWGDTLHVFTQNGKRVMLDRNYRVLRTTPIPAARLYWEESVLLPNGGVIVAGSIPTPDRFGFTLHLIDSTGNVQHSFGEDTAAEPGDDAARLLAMGKGGVWAARRWRPQLEQWSAEGQLVSQALLPTRDERLAHADTNPGRQHQLMDIREATDGRLWLLYRTPDARASAAPSRSAPLDRRFDALVLVVEPKCWQVVEAHRLPMLLLRFVGTHHAVGWEHTASQKSRATLWRLSHTPGTASASRCASHEVLTRTSQLDPFARYQW